MPYPNNCPGALDNHVYFLNKIIHMYITNVHKSAIIASKYNKIYCLCKIVKTNKNMVKSIISTFILDKYISRINS